MVISQPYKSMKQLNFQDRCLELDDRKINFTSTKEFLLKLSFLGWQREGEGNQSHGYQEPCLCWLVPLWQCIRGVNRLSSTLATWDQTLRCWLWTPARASQNKHQDRIAEFGSGFSQTTLFLPMSCDLGNKITFTTQLRHLKYGSVI